MIPFFLTQLLIIFFGLALALHSSLRSLSVAARIAFSFLAGSVLLTLEGIVLSLLGISWGERTLPLPFLIAVIFAFLSWRKHRGEEVEVTRVRSPISTFGSWLAVVVIAIASIQLIASVASSRADSPEHLLDWGAKGSRYAVARGLDSEFMAKPMARSLRPSQPPLWPITLAWSDLALKRETFTESPFAGFLWIGATAILAGSLLRRWLTREETLVTLAFWLAAVVNGVVAMRLAGAADIPMICFATVAATALISRIENADTIVASVALTGLALTRWDGMLLAGIVLVTFAFSLIRQRRFVAIAFPIAGSALWVGTVLSYGMAPFQLAEGDTFFRTLTADPLVALGGGSFFLSTVFPILLLAQGRRRILRTLPSSVALALSLLFLPLLSRLVSPELNATSIGRALLPITAMMIVTAAAATFGHPWKRWKEMNETI